MARLAIGPMILATAIFAVPALAATTSDTTTTATPPAASSSAVTPHSANMNAGMPASQTTTTAAGTTASSTPTYTTADGQMRVGKIVGASVYNDQNQSIGSVDDVLMSHDNKATTAVLSVGGFLGMGAKLVSVPFDQLKVQDNKLVMPGATKASLEGMPEYKYNA